MVYASNDQINPGQECAAPVFIDAEPSLKLQSLLSVWGVESDLDERPSEPLRTSFFGLPMLEQLRLKPYHSIELAGPFDLKAPLNDHRAKLFRSEGRLDEKPKSRLDRVLFDLGDGMFGYYERPSLKVYAPSPEQAMEVALQFRRYMRPPAQKKPGFHLLRTDGSFADTEFVPVKNFITLSDQDMQLHYGEDLIEWERDWLDRLTQLSSGVSVLFGSPGCGKTTYLRALMAKLLDRCVFYYLPISEFEVLSSPRFVSFWLQETRRHDEKHKIAILEDAEELLLPRDEGSRAKVSNLLNIGDGFLGDHLKLQVIATTNVPMQNLDPAVTRPGRLMGAREFPRLSPASALRLAGAKGIKALPEQADYSLAEIYCRAPLTAKLPKSRRAGFA